VFLSQLWQAEKLIAETLRALAAGQPDWPEIDAGKAIPWVEQKIGVTLATSAQCG
jgi:exodeoxyribonuclease V alpha subunit